MHEIIRQRRQALGLTQEQLAGKLGVSAPAVNKWEKAASFPDITLLPPLARALGVDLNTLLSFQEDLTEDDIGTFLNQLYETAQNQGTSAAFQLAQEKLRQFPNSDLLAYQLANLLEGIRVLYSGDTEDDGAQEALIGELYERSAQSADPEIREWAVYTLAGRCIAQGDLDRAEQLLNQLRHAQGQAQLLGSSAAEARSDGGSLGPIGAGAVQSVTQYPVHTPVSNRHGIGGKRPAERSGFLRDCATGWRRHGSL